MGRDKLTEIVGIRERGQGFGYSRGIQEIRALVDGWNGDVFRAPPQFIVIRIVTILEVFTRDWAAQIIDAGEPYVSRGADLVKGPLKIDFALAQALVGKQLSFGELVSHELTVNAIGDIDRIFSGLLATSLFQHLQGVVDRWAITVGGKPTPPLMPEPDWVRATLARLFKQRHIFVHELPEDQDVGAPGLDGYIRAASQFVNAADEAFNTLLHGDYPLTQLEMNEAAATDARKAKEALAGVLNALDPAGKDNDLQASQAAWESFRDRQAEFRSGINRPLPGSVAPMLYSSEVEKLTRARIEQLEWYLNRKEGDL
tara:strand:+ start:2263 stop:3204 length:942 start_codon:yes stop_codon:yes gene_type:complete